MDYVKLSQENTASGNYNQLKGKKGHTISIVGGGLVSLMVSLFIVHVFV